ncbi:MAG: hypothetical protein CBB97_25450 [Candidatus Endolissoclinum sp. TMED37]|nr:MAG: hypothetical protein CBB97_25450 [Candidatus Endolissoclinum sp. TMED37]
MMITTGRNVKTVKTNFDKQIELENQSIEITTERYKKALKDMEDRGRAGETKPVILLISRATEGLAEAIESWMYPTEKTRGWNAGRKATTRSMMKSLELSPFELAFCTLKVVFNHVVTERSDFARQTAICMSLADHLIHEANYRKFKQAEPKMLRSIQTHVRHLDTYKYKELEFVERAMDEKGILKCNLDHEDKLRLGHKLLELAIETTGMFESKRIKISRNKSPFVVLLTREIQKFIEESSEILSFFTPTYRPMIVPPLNWTGLYSGGYLSNHPDWKPDFIRRMTIQQRDMLKDEDLTKAMEAVNIAQQTKWKINKGVLEVMEDLWVEEGGGDAGIPNADPVSLPPRPWSDMTKHEWVEYKESHKEEVAKYSKACADIYAENREMSSKRLALLMQMEIAKQYSEYDCFYFPWNLDFRGRMYPIPTTLNPQSNDIGKGLLQFADGQRLTERGWYWWKVGCANAWGMDKIDFDSRVKWFDEHEEWISACGNDPYFDHTWREADNPFQFLAFCMEYVRGDGVSYLPINMDGTCNGLQHLSAMTLDPIGGKAVNLLDSEEPQDIYSEVAEELKEQLKVDDEDGVNRQWCQLWQDKIDRKLVKSGTMTTPYGVSEYGLKDQILEQAKDKLDGYTVDKFRASVYLAEKLGESIRNVVFGARNTMDWFETIVEESPHQFLRWRTPLTDFPVIQSYQRSKKKRVSLFVGSQRVQLHLQKQVNLPAEGKQKSGFSPNFVHSIDACMLMWTLTRLYKERKVKEFSLIHDSYGTHANHVDDLHEILRDVFFTIYKDGDILHNIKEQLGAVTEPPKNGELDIEGVLTSRYFFH